MATWDTLRNYIKASYIIKSDNGNSMTLGFSFQDGRSQDVLLQKVIFRDEEWVNIGTAVCNINELDHTEALRRNFAMVVGKLSLYKEVVVFEHALPLKDLDIDEFEIPFRVIREVGDDLEKEFAGGVDRF